MQARSLGHFNSIAVAQSRTGLFHSKHSSFRGILSFHVIAAFLKTFVQTVPSPQIMAYFLP